MTLIIAFDALKPFHPLLSESKQFPTNITYKRCHCSKNFYIDFKSVIRFFPSPTVYE